MVSKQKNKKKKKNGALEFEDFYQRIYQDRWESLKNSLLSPKEHIVFIPDTDKAQGFLNENSLKKFSNDAPLYYSNQNEELKAIGYFLDPASAYAPLSLEVKSGDRVLDLCAAPGGKSLILASQIGKKGTLCSNDKSKDRRLRLHQNLKKFLNEDTFHNQIRVTGFDASSWCLYEKEAYNKVLLDAPCSSERHVLESPSHLEDWSIGRTKRLSKLQWSMLASSWLVLEYGGRLVYSTCSISPLENDEVVYKLVKKFGEEVKIIAPSFKIGEKTKFGTKIFPDQTGFGPFYLSILEKVANS